jgi:hypothetical protein
LFYYSGFSLGGLLAGALWAALRHTAVGWFTMGVVFILPVYTAFVLLNRSAGTRHWGWNIGATLFGAVVVGGLGGIRTWSLEPNGWRESKTDWRFVIAVLVIGTVLAVAMYVAWW